MKKNAFTLIELLAVIVILAIVALVATPIVLNVINSSRDKSNLSSAYGIIDAARLYGVQKQFNGESIPSGDILGDLVIGGRKPESGSVYLNANGEIFLTALYDNKCYRKGFNESTIRVTDYDGTSCSSLELVDIFYEELQLPEEPEPVLDETMTISNNVVTNDFFHIMTDGEVQTLWDWPEYQSGITITNNVLTYVAEGNTKMPKGYIQIQVPNTIEDETIVIKTSVTINTTSGDFGIVVYDSNGYDLSTTDDTINNTRTLEADFIANKGETYILYICNFDYYDDNPSPDFTITNIQISGYEAINSSNLNTTNEFIKVPVADEETITINDENVYATSMGDPSEIKYYIFDESIYSGGYFYFELTMPQGMNGQLTVELLSDIDANNNGMIICDRGMSNCINGDYAIIGSDVKASISLEVIPGEMYEFYVVATSIKKMAITNMYDGNRPVLDFDAETNSYIYDSKIYDKNGNDITSKISISSDLPATISADTIEKAMYTNNYTILTSGGEKEIMRYVDVDFSDIFTEEKQFKLGLTSNLLYQYYDYSEGEWLNMEPNEYYGCDAIRVVKNNTTLYEYGFHCNPK